MKLISKEIYIVFGVYFETGKTIVNNLDDLDFSIDDCKDDQFFYVKLDKPQKNDYLSKLVCDYFSNRRYEYAFLGLEPNVDFSVDDKIVKGAYKVRVRTLEESFIEEQSANY